MYVQQPLPLDPDGPRPRYSWRDVAWIGHVGATRHADGSYRLTYGHVDMRTRMMVTEDLGDICADHAAGVHPIGALIAAVAELEARGIAEGLLG